MKKYILQPDKGFAGLELIDDQALSHPEHGEVKVRVHATSLNYRDLLIASGSYGPGVLQNIIPLSDGAGEVAAVGPGVENVKPGDRVAGAFFTNWVNGPISAEAVQYALGGTFHGMLTEYVTLPAQACLPIPEHMSYEEAATLPCAALTAWNALVDNGKLHSGQTVLLQGTGGVSIFALQLAKMMGAIVIQTSSSDEKLSKAKKLGADHLINYKSAPEWQDEVLNITEGKGADIIVEVGGYGTLERSLQAVKVGGLVATIGLVSGVGKINPLPIIMRAVRLNGIYVGSHAMFRDMVKAMETTKLKPEIDRVFPFEEAIEAYKYQESGAHLGKVVIKVG